MKSLFDPHVIIDVHNRIDELTPETPAKWGKMNVAQMLRHCQWPLDVALGNKELNTHISFMKKLVFKLFKSSLYNDKLWKPGIPTAPEYVVNTEHDFSIEKSNLQLAIKEFSSLKNKTTWDNHVFFGKLTPEQWGKSQYKHIDHHLRQFGV